MKGVTFTQLERFLVLSRELHFARAAEALGIAQSLLSEQTKQLEAFLHVRLFDRTSRHVELTAAGLVFREKAQHLMEALDGAIQATQDAAAARAGRLIIGHADEFNSSTLPRLIDHLKHIFPSCLIELKLLILSEMLESLSTGAIDIALMCPLPEDAPRSEFETLILPPVQLSVAVAANHRLAEREVVRIADLKDERFIEGPSEPMSGLERLVTRLFAASGYPRTISIRSMDLQLTLNLIARDVGIFVGYFPEPSSIGTQVRAIPISDPGAVMTRGVAWRRGTSSELLTEAKKYLRNLANATDP